MGEENTENFGIPHLPYRKITKFLGMVRYMVLMRILVYRAEPPPTEIQLGGGKFWKFGYTTPTEPKNTEKTDYFGTIWYRTENFGYGNDKCIQNFR